MKKELIDLGYVLRNMRDKGICPQWDFSQVISLWGISQLRVRFMTVKRCHH